MTSAAAVAVAAVTLHATHLATGRGPGSVVALDVNGDRLLDLVVANDGSGNASVFLGDGRGGFRPGAGSPFAAGPNPNDIASGDFNADGRPDLAFPNHDTPFVTVLLGDGGGGFAPAPGSPVRVDSRPHPHGLDAGDFNRDGKLDLVVESWQIDRVEVLFGDGKGGFTSPGPQFPTGRMPYQRVRAADVNRDGRSDVVTTDMRAGSVTVLLGDGRSGLAPARGSPFAVGASPFAVAAGDLNRDGKADLAVAHYSGQIADRGQDGVTILLGDGNGGFAPGPGSPFRAGHAPTRLAIGDIDGDDRADLAVANLGGNDVTVFRGDGQGGFAAAGTFPVGREPAGIAVADLDGDGRADVVSADRGSDRITLLMTRPKP
jgi:hypothetical protein